MSFGSKISALRKGANMTQAELGNQLNVTYQAISKWERDESDPDFATMTRIAKLFGVPLTYFADEEEGGAGAGAPAPAAETPPTADAAPKPEMIGVCTVCGRVLHEGEADESEPALTCRSCAEAKRKKEENRKNARERREKADKEKRERTIKGTLTKSFIVAAIAAVLAMVGGIVGGAMYGNGSAEKAEICITAIVFSLFFFTFVAQLFWDGAVVSCATGGAFIGTPGVIFDLDLDGFIFLIVAKIFFALLRLFVFFITEIVCIIAAILISPFTFFFALRRVRSGDLLPPEPPRDADGNIIGRGGQIIRRADEEDDD